MSRAKKNPWGNSGKHFESNGTHIDVLDETYREMWCFFIFYDVISGYDVIIPVPDVAQIVVWNVLYRSIYRFRGLIWCHLGAILRMKNASAKNKGSKYLILKGSQLFRVPPFKIFFFMNMLKKSSSIAWANKIPRPRSLKEVRNFARPLCIL